MDNLLRVGVISSTHGIRGEVKVFPTTDDVKRYSKLKNVILDTGKEQLELEVQSVKYFKQFVIVKFLVCPIVGSELIAHPGPSFLYPSSSNLISPLYDILYLSKIIT